MFIQSDCDIISEVINLFLIFLGKIVVFISRTLSLGGGSTWPGHIAFSLNPNFIKQIVSKNKFKTILVAGTNGKTTTAKLIKTILEKNGKKVFQNEGGANLLNGIASSIVLHSSILCAINYDYAIFEIDENTLPLILKEINNPDFIVVLNLFRDQLDRYGEINTIARKWADALMKLDNKTKLILNADDPQVAFLGLHPKGVNVKFIGIDHKNTTDKIQHASDSTYCPNCGEKLTYNFVYFSHLGDWICRKCNFKHPQDIFTSSPFYPLSGVYNEYNTNAAVLLAQKIRISDRNIKSALREFRPAFGRQEILDINGKKAQIFLSKNPTSLNESLKTIISLRAKNVLFVLNDRIPDGRDVSWIWDADFEEVKDLRGSISTAGDRTYDMALRLKYGGISVEGRQIYTDLKPAISENLANLRKNETLYILPTYSAMLEVRKILTGKKIL